jgi:hypothetical protein
VSAPGIHITGENPDRKKPILQIHPNGFKKIHPEGFWVVEFDYQQEIVDLK